MKPFSKDVKHFSGSSFLKCDLWLEPDPLWIFGATAYEDIRL